MFATEWERKFEARNLHGYPSAAFAPVFGDFQDMYIDFYRFTTIGAIWSSPVVDRGVVYFGSMDGNLYALQ